MDNLSSKNFAQRPISSRARSLLIPQNFPQLRQCLRNRNHNPGVHLGYFILCLTEFTYSNSTVDQRNFHVTDASQFNLTLRDYSSLSERKFIPQLSNNFARHFLNCPCGLCVREQALGQSMAQRAVTRPISSAGRARADAFCRI